MSILLTFIFQRSIMKRKVLIHLNSVLVRISPKGWKPPYDRSAPFIRSNLFQSVRFKFPADLKIDIDFMEGLG